MLQWQELTTGSYEFYEFDAGHFFINKFKEDVVDVINKSLSRY
jgi:surfactin synthase thioesterase subunit